MRDAAIVAEALAEAMVTVDWAVVTTGTGGRRLVASEAKFWEGFPFSSRLPSTRVSPVLSPSCPEDCGVLASHETSLFVSVCSPMGIVVTSFSPRGTGELRKCKYRGLRGTLV